MKQKTAIMELKDKIQASIGTMDGELNDYNSGWKQCLLDIQYQIDSQLLEKEKSQIINAANQTKFVDIDNFGICEDTAKGEQYYNETYKQD